jgi:CDGSH-type Zn-finger protein
LSKPLKPAKKIAMGKIKVTENGPYEVTGGVPLSDQEILFDEDGYTHGWKQTKQYPTESNYRLCRCGHSKNKPFCDETHKEIGFKGQEKADNTPYIEQAEETDGPELSLTDAKAFCADARFCDRAGGTWELTKHSDEPESRATAIEEAWDCPSGRLVVWDKDGTAIEPALEPSIGVVNDVQAHRRGPLWVRGGIPVESADGKIYERRNRVTLCRCGKSINKPFCDGSHMR